MFQGRLISTLPSSVSAFIILVQGSASSYLGGLQKSPCKTFPKLSHVISQLRIKLQAWAVPHAITSYCFTLLLLLSSVFGSHRPPHPLQKYQTLSWIFNAAFISPWIFQGKNETSSLGNSHVKCDSSSTVSGLASGQHIFLSIVFIMLFWYANFGLLMTCLLLSLSLEYNPKDSRNQGWLLSRLGSIDTLSRIHASFRSP